MEYIACIILGFLAGFAFAFQLAVLLLGVPSPLKSAHHADAEEASHHP